MVLVRMIFQLKNGRAHETVAAMKQAEPMVRDIMRLAAPMRLLTDLSGRWDTVVQEMVFENLADAEQGRTRLCTAPRFHQLQASDPHLRDSIESGYTEFYTIEM
jgi:hypothetical protein